MVIHVLTSSTRRTDSNLRRLFCIVRHASPRAPWAGKLKIINRPVIAADLNRNRAFDAQEFVVFPNNVLQADQNGLFEVIN